MSFWRLLGIGIIIAIIVATIWGVHYLIVTKQANEHDWQPVPDQATSTDQSASSSPLSVPLPQATTTPSSWKIYVNNAGTYQLQYPSDLILNQDGTTVTLAFPKNNYFHWPLEDDAKITVTATPACPTLTVNDNPFVATTTFKLNGYTFSGSEGQDAAAGNRYQEIVYVTHDMLCYQLDFFDHGVNGAGFYVGTQSLIKKYDDQHDADFSAVIDVFNGIVSSFSILH